MLSTFVLLGAAAFALAQDSSSTDTASITFAPTSSGTSASSSAAITHTIAVAKADHRFSPDVTLAEVGDVIQFEFYPTNHSVVRAEYGYPCIPYEYTGVNKFGFFTGFKPVDAILPNPPIATITINDTEPIFFYCGAEGSCINWQMVGVINPNATTSLVTQKELAKNSKFMLLPGEAWPEEDENPFTTSSAVPTSTSTPTPTHSSAPAATSSTAPSSSNSSLSPGAIAGIAIGAAAVALGAAVALFLCGRHSRNQRQSQLMHHQQNMPFIPPPASMSGSHPGHMSYASVPSMNKHMSVHSSVYSPALPGYQGHAGHESAMASPPLHASYGQSDALNPGTGPGSVTDATSPGQSPGVVPAVPAYSPGGHMSMQSTSTHPSLFSPPPPGAHVHEMAAPLPAQGVHQVMPHGGMQSPTSITPMPQGEGQSGIMGFIRKSSVSKAGGVERYS